MEAVTESITLQVRENLVIQLRRAKEDDLPVIARIFDEQLLSSTISFDEHSRTDEEWRHWLYNFHGERYPVWMVVLEGTVAGWVSLSPAHPKSAYRFSTTPGVYLDGPAQRKGLGRVLLSFLEDEGKKIGFHALVCEVCTEKEAVGRWLTQLGYREVGVLREVGYKFGRWLDVTIYHKLVE